MHLAVRARGVGSAPCSGSGGLWRAQSLGRPSCLWAERPPFGSWPPPRMSGCAEARTVAVAFARELSEGRVDRVEAVAGPEAAALELVLRRRLGSGAVTADLSDPCA